MPLNDSYFIWNLRVFSQTAFLNEAVKRIKKEGRSGHKKKKKRTALLSSFVNSCAERKNQILELCIQSMTSEQPFVFSTKKL